MEFKKFSPEVVAELLIFLADHEDFNSINGLAPITKQEVKGLLKEIADNLKEHLDKQVVSRKETVKQSDLTDNVYKVISRLTPHEENQLFKTFKIS
ncbi:MAG TPA: hypothetical protein VJC18_00250 [bacterium]|nr:hypothetical protein [bacterium]